jgi:hypothetical protein
VRVPDPNNPHEDKNPMVPFKDLFVGGVVASKAGATASSATSE